VTTSSQAKVTGGKILIQARAEEANQIKEAKAGAREKEAKMERKVTELMITCQVT
jgi:hypothetical protein